MGVLISRGVEISHIQQTCEYVTHSNDHRLVQYFIPSATALAPSSLILLLPRLYKRIHIHSGIYKQGSNIHVYKIARCTSIKHVQ